MLRPTSSKRRDELAADSSPASAGAGLCGPFGRGGCLGGDLAGQSKRREGSCAERLSVRQAASFAHSAKEFETRSQAREGRWNRCSDRLSTSVIVLFSLVANRQHDNFRRAGDLIQRHIPGSSERDDQFPLGRVL